MRPWSGSSEPSSSLPSSTSSSIRGCSCPMSISVGCFCWAFDFLGDPSHGNADAGRLQPQARCQIDRALGTASEGAQHGIHSIRDLIVVGIAQQALRGEEVRKPELSLPSRSGPCRNRPALRVRLGLRHYDLPLLDTGSGEHDPENPCAGVGKRRLIAGGSLTSVTSQCFQSRLYLLSLIGRAEPSRAEPRQRDSRGNCYPLSLEQ